MTTKRALVTGASKGIGAAVAKKLATLGYELLLPSHSELDLASDKSVDSFLVKNHDPVDILVNNAGINPLAEVMAIQDNKLEETIRVNLISPLRLTRGLLPGMIKNKYGRIVNVSSIWSLVAKPGRGAYAASKGGLNALTRTLAVEVAKHNILVNAVLPGFVDTELTRKNNPPPQLAELRANIPLGRLAGVEEIAELIAWLCSEKNSYLTGQNIVIDGGYTCL